MASIQRRPNKLWRARYRDAAGKEHSRHFQKKIDAQRWLDEVTASIVTGQYVDPNAGKIRFREYAEQWRTAQVHRPSSVAHVETMLRRHAYPYLGDRQIASILPSEVQAWVKRLGTDDKVHKRKALAPATVGVIHGIVSGILRAAVRDRKIMANPCEGHGYHAWRRSGLFPSRRSRSRHCAMRCRPSCGRSSSSRQAPASGRARCSGSPETGCGSLGGIRLSLSIVNWSIGTAGRLISDH